MFIHENKVVPNSNEVMISRELIRAQLKCHDIRKFIGQVNTVVKS